MPHAESYEVALIGGAKSERAMFEISEPAAYCCVLHCHYRGKTVFAEGPDFFEALISVRHLLQQEGLTPYCYGASLNVFPSGMARDMGSGLKAYRLTIGKPAKIDDLVEIFAAGSDITCADVEAQARFYEEWIASTRM